MGNVVTACGCGKDIEVIQKGDTPLNRNIGEWTNSENGLVSTLYGTPTSLESSSLKLFEEDLYQVDINTGSETTDKSTADSRKKTVQFDDQTLRQQRLEYLKKYIHERENKEESALTKAVNDGSSYNVIQELIEAGEDVDARDQKGDPILYTALFYSQFDAVRLLLRNGADVYYRNSQWDPIIYTALQTNRPEILKLILEYGADVDCRNSKGDTILYSAILSKQISMLDILLRHGADVNLRNTLGTSCLEEAMTSNQIDVLRLLVDAGADVDIKDREGNTLLHVAMMFKQTECLEVLLSLGADVNLPDKEGNPVLEMAILMQDLPSIQLLLKHGADVNLKNEKGIPVFFKAIYRRGCDIMKLLLNNGMDVNCQDSMGNSAIFIAIDKNNCDIIKLLTNSGIDNNLQNNEGQTCLDYAKSFGVERTTIVQTLQETCTVMSKEVSGKCFSNRHGNVEERAVYKDNYVSFCDRALFLTSKQSEQHINQWASQTCRGRYWFSKVNIFCDHVHIDCIIDSRLQKAYTTLRDITLRRSSKHKGDGAVDTEDIEDPHPFEADEPKAVTEFELLLTTVNKIRDGFDINRTSEIGDSLLHLAVKYRHNCLIRYLLQNEANPYKNNAKSINAVRMVFKLYDKEIAIPLCHQIANDFSKSILIPVNNVWAGWRCDCKQNIRPDRELCSDQCTIAAEYGDAMPPCSYFYKGFKVISDYRNVGNGELEAIRAVRSSLEKMDFSTFENAIQSYNWNELFQKHKHLKYVYPSLVRSVNYLSEKYEHEIKHEYCFRLVCSVKGVIPIEENHFPEDILGLPTDCIDNNGVIAVTTGTQESYQLVSFLNNSFLDTNNISYSTPSQNEDDNIPVIDSYRKNSLLVKFLNAFHIMNQYEFLPRAVLTFPIDYLQDDFFQQELNCT